MNKRHVSVTVTHVKLCQCAFDRRFYRSEITQVFSQLVLENKGIIEHGVTNEKK